MRGDVMIGVRAVVFMLGCAVVLGFTGAVLALRTSPASAAVVVCDSVELQPVSDPRDPYLRAVAQGCTAGDVSGPAVEVRFID